MKSATRAARGVPAFKRAGRPLPKKNSVLTSNINYISIMANYDSEFDTPENMPDGASGPNNPISREIDYRAGRTPAGFAATATPEMAGAGFSYYSKDAGQRFELPEVTMYILGSYWQLRGEVGEGRDRTRFTSNFLPDTAGVFSVREKYTKGGGQRFTGTRDEVREWAAQNGIEKGVNLGVTLIAYVPQLNAVVELQCTSRIQAALGKAVKAATGKMPSKWFFLGFNELTTEYWAFHFSGAFCKVEKEGADYKSGEMFFEPLFKCGVIRSSNEKARDRFEQLTLLYQGVVEYVKSVNDRITGTYNRASMAPPPPPPRQAWPAQTAPAAHRPPSNAAAVPPPVDEPAYYAGGGGDLPF